MGFDLGYFLIGTAGTIFRLESWDVFHVSFLGLGDWGWEEI